MKTLNNDYCLEMDEKFIQNFALVIGKINIFIFLNWLGQSTQLIIFFVLYGCVFPCAEKDSPRLEKPSTAFIGGSTVRLLTCFLVMTVLLLFCLTDYPAVMAMKEFLEKYETLGCFVEGQGNMAINEYLKVMKMGEVCWWSFMVMYAMNTLYFLTWSYYSFIMLKKSPCEYMREYDALRHEMMNRRN